MAALGIELAIIQLMARWASAIIMGYVRDAPLLAITGTTRAKAAARADHDATVVQSWREADLRKQMDEMAERLAKLQDDCSHLKGIKISDDLIDHEDVRDEAPEDEDVLVAVVNTVTSKTQIAKVAPGAGAPQDTWRARCPWYFGFSPHRTCKPSEALADEALRVLRCRRCWRGIAESSCSSGE